VVSYNLPLGGCLDFRLANISLTGAAWADPFPERASELKELVPLHVSRLGLKH